MFTLIGRNSPAHHPPGFLRICGAGWPGRSRFHHRTGSRRATAHDSGVRNSAWIAVVILVKQRMHADLVFVDGSAARRPVCNAFTSPLRVASPDDQAISWLAAQFGLMRSAAKGFHNQTD
jgi:hypothetical protein